MMKHEQELQESILMDFKRQDDKVRKKVKVTYGILIFTGLLLLAAIGVTIGYTVKYFNKKKDRIKTQNSYNEMLQQQKYLAFNKNINLSNTAITNLSLDIQDVMGSGFPRIEVLTLDNNFLTAFNGFTIDNISTLVLDENYQLGSFQTNSFSNLSTLSIQNIGIVNFTDNNLPNVKNLVQTVNSTYFNFTNNTLPSLNQMIFDPNLKYFNLNNLHNLKGNLTIDNSNIQQCNNNDFSNIDTLFINSPSLLQFTNNIYTNINNFQADAFNTTTKTLDFTGYKNLQTIILTQQSNITTVIILNAPVNFININCSSITNFTFIYPFGETQNLMQANFDNNNILLLPGVNYLQLANIKESYIDITLFTSLITLNVNNCTISSFTNDPNNGKYTNITLIKTNIQNFSNYNFPNLLSLTLVNNIKLSNITNITFMALTTLVLNNFDLQQFKDYHINNKLTTLDITGSNANNFDFTFFQGISLTTLVLDSNSLSSFDPSAYPSLVSLTIKNNPIQKLTFIGLTNLKNLLINLNSLNDTLIINNCININDISTSTFQNVKTIDIEGTPIISFSNQNLNYATNITLINNNLNTFTGNSLNNLQALNIQQNSNLITVNINSPALKNLQLNLTNLTTLTIINSQLNQAFTLTTLKLAQMNLDSVGLQNFSNYNLPSLNTLNMNNMKGLSIFDDSQMLRGLVNLTISQALLLSNLTLSNSLISLQYLSLNTINLTSFTGYNLSKLNTLILNGLTNLTTFNDSTTLTNVSNLSIINASSLKTLVISPNMPLLTLTLNGLNISNFSNYNFPTLTSLSISSTNLTDMTNIKVPVLQRAAFFNVSLTNFDQLNNINQIYIDTDLNVDFNIANFNGINLTLINTKFNGTSMTNNLRLQRLTINIAPLTKLNNGSFNILNQLTVTNTNLQEYNFNISSLTRLVLNNNKLSTFKSMNYTNLNYLDLSSNQLNNLQNLTMPALTYLDLSNNKIDDSFDFSMLTGINSALQILNITSNDFKNKTDTKAKITKIFSNSNVII